MKRITIELMLLIGMICCCFAARGEGLEGIRAEGQRITGEIAVRFGNGEPDREWILVDCELPASRYSGEVFEVTARRFKRSEIEHALKAVGQSDGGSYQCTKTEARYTSSDIAAPAAPISRQEAEAQAVRIGRELFEALGIDVVSEPVHIERPYDFDAFVSDRTAALTHRYSDISELLEMAKAQWKRTRKYETREASYTLVRFDVMAEGMRVWNQQAYPAGDEAEPDAWRGFAVSASVLVSDSGEIAEVSVSHIPEIKSSRPPEAGERERYEVRLLERRLPLVSADCWRDALTSIVQRDDCTGIVNRNTKEHVYQTQYMSAPVTRMAAAASYRGSIRACSRSQRRNG